MTSMTKDGLTFYFEYDEEGRRIREIKNGLVTNYYYSGDQLIAEVSEECLAVYLYDESGSPIGYQYHEPSFGEDVFVTFFFEKNLQGDVVAVYTENGTLVTTYEYDAWGNYIETFYNPSVYPYETHSPISYRGYYYDREYGFYCLGTRFYDPVTRRFISADTSAVLTATPTTLTDKNLYAYCDNNPVMRTDNGGDFWIQMGVGAAVGFIGGIIDQAISGDWSLNAWIQTGVSTLEGAATAVVGPAASALISGLAGATNSAISGNDTEQIMTDAFISAGVSLAGSGAQLAVGRVFAGEFVDRASKTQLKTFANSLGYVGSNFKSSSSWTGKIMMDASKAFIDNTLAQVVGQSTSFVGSRVWNYLSPW